MRRLGSDGTLELALPRGVFLGGQRHGPGVERGHIGPRADAVSGQQLIELDAALPDAEAQAALRRGGDERGPTEGIQQRRVHW